MIVVFPDHIHLPLEIILCRKQMTNTLNRVCRCAGWSAPLILYESDAANQPTGSTDLTKLFSPR